MTRVGCTIPYRGFEIRVDPEGTGEWLWHYHPKIGQGIVRRGRFEGTRELAIATCQAAIDAWLGPSN